MINMFRPSSFRSDDPGAGRGSPNTPNYLQGHSVARALKGQPKPEDWRTVTYYRYWMHMAHGLRVPAHFGIHNERYKLVRSRSTLKFGKGVGSARRS